MPRWWKPPTRAQSKQQSKRLRTSARCLRVAELAAHRAVPGGDRYVRNPGPRNVKFYEVWGQAYDDCVKQKR